MKRPLPPLDEAWRLALRHRPQWGSNDNAWTELALRLETEAVRRQLRQFRRRPWPSQVQHVLALMLWLAIEDYPRWRGSIRDHMVGVLEDAFAADDAAPPLRPDGTIDFQRARARRSRHRVQA